MPAPDRKKPPPCAVIEIPLSGTERSDGFVPFLHRSDLPPRPHRYRGRGVSFGRAPNSAQRGPDW